MECLRYLVHLCTELGRREDAQKYMTELRKAERAAAAEASAVTLAAQQRMQAGSPSDHEGGSMMGSPMMNGGGGGMMEDGGMNLNASLNVPVTTGKKVVAKEAGGHDDWGNEELGDDLLPM